MAGDNKPEVQFDWDERKAVSNSRKHGITFELATSVFNDPFLLTVADIEHSQTEERWFGVGLSSNGILLAIGYLWDESTPGLVEIRLITARKATAAEIGYYKDNQ